MPRLCNRCHRLGVGLRPGLPVPLSLPFWRIDGAMASPLKIRRDATLCVDCGKCAKACPSIPPVDKLIPSNPPNAWAVCSVWPFTPKDGALFMSAPRAKKVPAGAIAAGLAVLFFGSYLTARVTGHWITAYRTVSIETWCRAPTSSGTPGQL